MNIKYEIFIKEDKIVFISPRLKFIFNNQVSKKLFINVWNALGLL